MPRRIFTPLLFLFAFSLTLTGALSAKAASDQQELIDSAKYTMERMLKDEVFSQVPAYLARAKAVLIAPSVFKAGFFFGGEGGSAVLLGKNAEGEWSYPAFYTLGGASFGLQFGAENSEVLYVILTDDGLESVLKTQVTLGADASVAVGPVGAGIEGATTTSFGADIVVFSRSVGLFGGVAGEGTVIYGRKSWNELYYGEGATAKAIVQEGGVRNENADALRAVLSGK
ncbi:MAG: lipid-binding SYLF domain-containing protein [Alphaproteobacteria bacterium]|nr:lipid-binding SYLF domain-containing protein [Alphaproteobacteria bacterium]